jgi:hypothetical protein
MPPRFRAFFRRFHSFDPERLRRGPSEADLRELPATSAADWANAELLIPIDQETYREFESFIAARRKKAAG